MSITVESNPVVLTLLDAKKRIAIEVYQPDPSNPTDDILVDPIELDLSVRDLGNQIVLSDSFTSPPAGGTRIVRVDTGKYYLLWGDPTASVNTPTQKETDTVKRVLFFWTVVGAGGVEDTQWMQAVDVADACIWNHVIELRGLLDKSAKDISLDPKAFCPLGYSDGMLMSYLRGGMQLINAYQPYPTWCDVGSFPSCFAQTLYDAAMVVGVNAQTLFAIDSDMENWSDQGNAFVINHTPKLAAFNQAMTARLDALIPKMKMHFVNVGGVKTEVGPNFRLTTLLNMAPTGATFRNVFTA